METIKGIASNVRNTVSVSGGSHDTQVSTTHTAIFVLSGQQVNATSNEPLLINEGDSIVAVGSTSKGIFNALAYKNLTTQAEGGRGWIVSLIFGIIFSFAAISIFMTFSNPFFGILPKIVSGVFFAVGVAALHQSWQVKKAISMLHSALQSSDLLVQRRP